MFIEDSFLLRDVNETFFSTSLLLIYQTDIEF